MVLNPNNKVLVTGATGFIGQNLVPALLKKKYEVTVIARSLDRIKDFSWFGKVRFIQCDYHKDKFISKKKIPQNVIHLAWKGLPNYKSKFHLEENLVCNYFFLSRLIELGVKKIFVLGTCLEYGMLEGKIKSVSQTDPHTPYGLAKNLLRLLLLKKQNFFNFKLQWGRLFYTYGNGQSSNSLISKLEKAIKEKRKEFNMSFGEQVRDYLHIDDVVQKILTIFSVEENLTVNICSGKPITIKDFVIDYLKKRNKKITLNFGYYDYNDYEPMKFWGENDINSDRMKFLKKYK